MDALTLAKIMPRAPLPWLVALVDAMPRWFIDTPTRQSAFLGQIAHESVELTRLEENLNYSVARMMQVWPSKFPTSQSAIPYAYKPEKLANYVYANRIGNGDEASGDGWMYRGRGPIQITGRENYRKFGLYIDKPLEQFPELALLPEHGAAVACAFWQHNGLNELADKGDHAAITRKVNGGQHGLEQRIAYANTAARVLA